MTHDRIKLNTQISEEAAEWFVEFRTGDIDAARRRAFDAWVRSSPEHLRAYLEIAAIWNEGSALDAERTLDSDALTTRARAQDNLVPLAVRGAPGDPVPVSYSYPGERARNTQPSRARSARRWVIAASVAVLGFVAATRVWLQIDHGPSYAAEVGEQRSIRLADGSTVELNSRSRLRVRFTKAERTVELLDGQALFTVAKNPARPFIVHSGDTRVRAVGTQFDVYKKRSGTIVTVVEGRVAVLADHTDAGAGADAAVAPSLSDAAPGATQLARTQDASETGRSAAQSSAERGGAGATVFLEAGEQVTVTAQTAPRPVRVNVAAMTAWTQRQLVLESASLGQVAEEFNRYSTRKLVIEESARTPLRLSGVFVTDPDFLIRYLRARADTTVHESESEIRIVHHD